MKRNRKFNPLSYIPSADVVRQKLSETKEQARRLEVLLRTAEEIEREQCAPTTSISGRAGEVANA